MDPPAGNTIGINGSDHGEVPEPSTDKDISTAGANSGPKADSLVSYLGEISQFLASEMIDNAGAGFGAHSTLGYSTNSDNPGWALTATDGLLAQRLALLGQYAAASFVMASDGHGSTSITNPPELVAQMQLTKPHG
jgi:hypothetical protein